jgi:hypothetical protein
MTQYNTWEDGAQAALKHIADFAGMIKRDDNIFDVVFETLGTIVREYPDDTDMMVNMLERAGIGALHCMADMGPFSLEEMHRLLCSKQHDYGHGNILHFGTVGVAVRLCDKIARRANLLGRGATAMNETLTDTYMDILGYAAIALMLEDGSFELELGHYGK